MKLPDPGDSAAGENGDYPFVALDIPEKNQGNMQEGETIEVSVFCALLDESPYETVEQNIKRLPGIDKRDQFRVLVLTALVGAEVSGGVITHVDTVNLPVEYSPEFAAAMAVTIERPYAFRENRFE